MGAATVRRSGANNIASLRARPAHNFQHSPLSPSVLPKEMLVNPQLAKAPSFSPRKMMVNSQLGKAPLASPKGMLVNPQLLDTLLPHRRQSAASQPATPWTARSQRPSTAPPKVQSAVATARHQISSRFIEMHQAFQHFDLDNSGKLERPEIARMCASCNIKAPADIDALMRYCDLNGDDVLDYREFVDAFAQDTVQREKTWYAGNTRQQSEARCFAVTPNHVNPAEGVFGLRAVARFGEPPRPINCAQGISGRLSGSTGPLVDPVRERVQQRYTWPLKAFQHVDTDGDGSITRREMAHAIAHWNLPADSAQVSNLMAKCDTNNDGVLSYNEFRRGLFA